MKWWYSLQYSGNLNFPAHFLLLPYKKCGKIQIEIPQMSKSEVYWNFQNVKKCGKIQIPQILDKVQLLGSKFWAFWAFPQLFGRFKTDLGCAILCPFLPLFCNFCLEMWEVLLKTRLLQKWEKCAVLLFFFQDFQDFFPAFPALTLHFNQFNCGFFFVSLQRYDTSIFCTVTSSSNAQRRFQLCIGNPMRNRCKDLDSMPTLLQFQKAGVELQVRVKPLLDSSPKGHYLIWS